MLGLKVVIRLCDGSEDVLRNVTSIRRLHGATVFESELHDTMAVYADREVIVFPTEPETEEEF